MPTIQQIRKDHTVGNLPLLPYSSMVASCFLWATYGLLKQDPKIWLTNVIGLLFGAYYFHSFVQFAPPRSPSLPGSQLQHIQGMAALCIVTLFLAMGPILNDPTELIGNLSVLFCVALFGSPLAALKSVLITKSSASIPLPFTLATVVNCFLWSVAGLFEMNDANVYVPNLLGLTFGLAQVALKVMYKDGRSSSSSDDGDSELELML
jgi:solute carrier family 50 (sugar transporter)